MKLAVVNSGVGFVSGGAEFLANSLVQKLNEYGHDAALVRTFYVDQPLEAIPRSILAARLTRVKADRIICLKFPAFYIPHDEKILWILHQYRGAYDLWDTPFGSLPLDETGSRIRDCIRDADNQFLRESRKIYACHESTAKRLLRWNGISAEPMLCPHGDMSRYRCEGYSDTIVALGRLSWIKRQHLAVEAMAHTKSPVKLLVAGRSEDERLTQHIRDVIRSNRLEERIRFEPRFISETEKTEALATSLAAVSIPFEEDSHGYVTVEAFYSRKPCVSCHDSGGITSVVKAGLTGYVTAPEPRALAEAFDQLYFDRQSARRMGECGWQLAQELPDKWDGVITRLTA